MTSPEQSGEGFHRSLMEYEDTSWERHAACRTEDPELFFPKHQRPEEIDRAKVVCARCTVAVQCLNYALKTRTADGVWGGASEDERSAMLRRSAKRGY